MKRPIPQPKKKEVCETFGQAASRVLDFFLVKKNLGKFLHYENPHLFPSNLNIKFCFSTIQPNCQSRYTSLKACLLSKFFSDLCLP